MHIKLLTALSFCFLTLSAQLSAAEEPGWESSAAFGLNASRGNSDSLFATIGFNTERRRPETTVRGDIQASYGERNSETVAKEILLSSQYNRAIHEKTFWMLSGSFEHNETADIEYRYTVAPGFGYYFIKEDDRLLEFSGGLAYVGEKFSGVREDNYISLHLSERYELRKGNSRFWNSLLLLPEISDINNFILKGELGLDAGLNSRWGLRLVLRNIYDNSPAEGRVKNDLMMISMLTLKL